MLLSLKLGKVVEHSALDLHEVRARLFSTSVCGRTVEGTERLLAIIPVVRAALEAFPGAKIERVVTRDVVTEDPPAEEELPIETEDDE